MNIKEVLDAMELDSKELEKQASVKTEVETKVTEDQYTEDEMNKVAEADAEGRIMARGFWDEMKKMAQIDPAGTPLPADPGAIRRFPAVEVGRGDGADTIGAGGEAAAQARATVNQLPVATLTGNGEITVNGNPQVVAKKDPQEGNPPLAADVAIAQEKQAADEILTNLFNKYCK